MESLILIYFLIQTLFFPALFLRQSPLFLFVPFSYKFYWFGPRLNYITHYSKWAWATKFSGPYNWRRLWEQKVVEDLSWALMANVGRDREESIDSWRENQFVNLEHRRDRQHTPSVVVESYHTMRTERSHSNIRSHASHYQETQKLQREIDRLRSKLRRRERGKRSPSPPLSDGSKGSRDCLYCHRSRTTSNESYSASMHKNR